MIELENRFWPDGPRICARISELIQAFFLLMAITIGSINAIPALRIAFVNYGSRVCIRESKTKDYDTHTEVNMQSMDSSLRKEDGDRKIEPNDKAANSFARYINYLAAWRVPHAYFVHFYILSVVLSLFWLYQIIFSDNLYFRQLCRLQSQTGSIADGDIQRAARKISADHSPGDLPTMTLQQILLVTALMMIQGIRRCWECLAYMKLSSSSTMWIGHYILGLLFYLVMSVAVWIEGAETLLALPTPLYPTIASARFIPPTLVTFLTLPIFILASGIQHDSHAYLSSLKKYSLPVHPIFNLLIAPHYTCECLLYASLAIMAAPQGQWINKTIAAAFGFVFVNLAVTAKNTQTVYLKKFDRQVVQKRYIMVPGIW